MKKYEILGGNLPVVVCELSAGESMITESGSMSWMSPNMKMETISGGGMKKMFGRLMSGDSAFQNRYTAEGADGMIAFASSFPGAIKALEISNGHSMIVQKSAFLSSEEPAIFPPWIAAPRATHSSGFMFLLGGNKLTGYYCRA